MFYYLKVNRNEGYMIRNLKHWLEIISYDNSAEYVILCDKDEVKSKILDRIEDINPECFITSNRTAPELVEITKNNTSDFWNNASYSHLTTFYDAKERDLSDFWNIDADDTTFCAEPGRVYEILKEAKEYSVNHGLDVFSFDMSYSRRNGAFWSFGVTYTSNSPDWFSVMLEHCYDEYYLKIGYADQGLAECIDTYFTYLGKCGDVRLGTFYVENCKFVHYSNDFVYRPWCSWFAVYKEGMIYKPLLDGFMGLSSIGHREIVRDVVKIDIGLSDEEQTRWLIAKADENDNNKKILYNAIKES